MEEDNGVDLEVSMNEIMQEPPGQYFWVVFIVCLIYMELYDVALDGYIEKKGGKTLGMSGGWQNRLLVI